MSADGSTTQPTTAASPAVKMEQDTAMSDTPIPVSYGETSQPSSTSTHTGSTVVMPRMGTTNGTAAAATNGSATISASADASLPTEPAHHGAPTRDWINTKVTGVLLEGMKLLAAERPAAPLRALGEYLLKKSAELEGTSGEDDAMSGM